MAQILSTVGTDSSRQISFAKRIAVSFQFDGSNNDYTLIGQNLHFTNVEWNGNTKRKLTGVIFIDYENNCLRAEYPTVVATVESPDY